MQKLNEESLIDYAKEIAREFKISSKSNFNDKSLKELNDNFATINLLYKKLNEGYKKNITVPASEWLLDNFYIIEENAKQIKRDFKKRVYRSLPVLTNEKYKGYTRVFKVAEGIVNSNDGKIDENIIKNFITTFESEQVLFMREIWGLSLLIRMALINRVKILSEKIYETYREWERAENWVKNYNEGSELKLPISDIDVNSAFFEHLAYRLRRNGKSGLLILSRIENYIERYGVDIDSISRTEHSRQAGLKISIGNCILSLKYVSNINWNELFNEISIIEKLFNNDPQSVYKDMDLASKNAYRARVQSIANAYKVSEVHVARKCISCAQKFSDDLKLGHIGYYLWGKGQSFLEKELLGKSKYKYRLKREIEEEPFPLYISLVVLFTFFISTIFYVVTRNFIPINAYYWIGLGLVSLIALDGGICLTNYFLNRIFKPRIIPRMDFKQGVPKDAATMVIVPTLLSNEKRVAEMLDNIEKYYVGTNDKNVFFALVGDAKECDRENLPEDASIVKTGIEGVENLNYKYNTNSFFFVYRKRFYNKLESKWLGWERKRGAIIRFNNFLLTGNRDDYKAVSHGFDKLPKIKYVLTVDADTFIPIDECKKLIGAMAHPFNAPVLNQENTAVIDGHGLIQPRIGIDVVSANKSIFSRTFAGSGGIDPYVCASSDIYQDLFGEAIFTGKGIYDLEIFQKVLANSIPENAILSHDLLEGSYLRAGLATDIELIDGYPSKYNSYAMRAHRWVRGDWQVVPWLFDKVYDTSHKKIKNPINKISKWKIFDNLRRSLVSPLILFTIIFSFLVLPGSAVWWSLSSIIIGIRGNKKQFLYQVIFLGFYGWLMFTAIIKTLYRMIFSKKNFLEWVTAADMETKLKNTLPSFYNLMKSSVIISTAILVSAYFIKNDIASILFASTLAVLWSLAPFIAYYISKDTKSSQERLSKKDKEKIKEYAKRTWSYFDDLMNEENNFLPPDNFQEDPPNGVAYRTSPTNIGLGFLALLSACDLGFISEETMLERVDKLLISVEKLEKWNGHLLNWYNTKTLKPLYPRYISTVDSGNLLAYAITLREALDKEKAGSIITRLDNLINQMRFAVLFDENKNVFSIGYNLEEGRLTNSYYDLLASESRQISFLAVARHEVPVKHWFALGRSLTRMNGKKGLISWTGTMFEYLMPLLLMKNYNNTLLNETYDFVVSSQIEYAKKKNVVWGISESAFYNFDINLNYQYKALGVPWLGLKRGLIDDTVISPYSTMLALMVRPVLALKNLVALEKFDMLGKYGFYEAIDFTPGRLKLTNQDKKYAAIKSFMVHHQGMSLLAMDNVINDNIMQKRFHSNVYVKSADYLLQEKVPGDIIYTKDSKEKVVPSKECILPNIETDRFIANVKSGHPNVQALTNGNLTLIINDRGIGYLKYRNLYINRYRNNFILNNYGQIFYIKCIQNNQIWTSCYMKTIKEPDKYYAIFSGDKVKFSRRDGMIETNEEIVISTEDNVEVRRLTIVSHLDIDLDFEVTSFNEIVLGNIDADIAHRTFSNMFIKTDFRDNVILVKRKERDNSENNVLFATNFIEHGEQVEYQFETDRVKFIGRGRDELNPAAVFLGTPLTGSIGSVLDPVVATKRYVRLKANESVRINYITGISDSENEAVNTAKKYLSSDNINRAFRLAFARNQVEMSYLNVNSEEVMRYDDLMKYIV